MNPYSFNEFFDKENDLKVIDKQFIDAFGDIEMVKNIRGEIFLHKQFIFNDI